MNRSSAQNSLYNDFESATVVAPSLLAQRGFFVVFHVDVPADVAIRHHPATTYHTSYDNV